jgi:N-hydroxyarylamine O-acetyltransferase
MTSSRGVSEAEPSLAPSLVERVLGKVGLKTKPTLDLAGLNALYAALCAGIPFDNVQKRIWFSTDRTKPSTGGDPIEFFENWVRHGTGGTCWPVNGGMYALARALGFRAHRIAGSVIIPGYPAGANHGSVLVNLDGVEYIFDLVLGAFKVLPLVTGRSASTGTGIHDVQVVPLEDGAFELIFRLGWAPVSLPFRTEPEHDPVDHAFFLARYDNANRVGFFNDTLLITRRFANSIVTIGRMNKIVVSADGVLTKTELTTAQRDEALVQELGLSPEVVSMIPPDVPEGVAPF